jgi:hypothetical protein
MENHMNHPLDRSRIAFLAYQLWESEGRPEGRSDEHWLEAERRLREEMPESVGSTAADLQGDVAKLDGDLDAQPYERSTRKQQRQSGPSPSGVRQSPSTAGRGSAHALSR